MTKSKTLTNTTPDLCFPFLLAEHKFFIWNRKTFWKEYKVLHHSCVFLHNVQKLKLNVPDLVNIIAFYTEIFLLYGEKKTAKITFFTCRKSSWFPNGRLLKQENLTWFGFLPQCLAKNRALGSKLNHLFYIFSFIKGTYVNMWKNATISNLPT